MDNNQTSVWYKYKPVARMVSDINNTFENLFAWSATW